MLNLFEQYLIVIFCFVVLVFFVVVFSNSISKCSVPVENLKTVQHYPFQTGSSPIWVETVAFCNSSIYIHFQLKWKNVAPKAKLLVFQEYLIFHLLMRIRSQSCKKAGGKGSSFLKRDLRFVWFLQIEGDSFPNSARQWQKCCYCYCQQAPQFSQWYWAFFRN